MLDWIMCSISPILENSEILVKGYVFRKSSAIKPPWHPGLFYEFRKSNIRKFSQHAGLDYVLQDERLRVAAAAAVADLLALVVAAVQGIRT